VASTVKNTPADSTRRTAVLTGASSGVGAATAGALAEAGFDLILCARRLDRLQDVAEPIGARAVELDVTDPDSVDRLASQLDRLDLLVNNAGFSVGLDPVDTGVDEAWRAMWETNVLGVVRMTRGLLPALRRAERGHIINTGSTSGFETYAGGAGYTSSKHALRALTRTLRRELMGEPIRVTEVSPGLIDTEFAVVRFDGDAERAAKTYAGMRPLAAEDVAHCIAFAATRPAHVNIDEIVVRPLDQVDSNTVRRD